MQEFTYGERFGTYHVVKLTFVDPTNHAAGSEHVARGGSWGYAAWGRRSAYRGSFAPNHRYNGLGFRLALTMAPENVKASQAALAPRDRAAADLVTEVCVGLTSDGPGNLQIPRFIGQITSSPMEVVLR